MPKFWYWHFSGCHNCFLLQKQIRLCSNFATSHQPPAEDGMACVLRPHIFFFKLNIQEVLGCTEGTLGDSNFPFKHRKFVWRVWWEVKGAYEHNKHTQNIHTTHQGLFHIFQMYRNVNTWAYEWEHKTAYSNIRQNGRRHADRSISIQTVAPLSAISSHGATTRGN